MPSLCQVSSVPPSISLVAPNAAHLKTPPSFTLFIDEQNQKVTSFTPVALHSYT